MYQAFRRGMQSVADNASAHNYSKYLGDDFLAKGMEQMQQSGLSATELADSYPQIQASANQYAKDFLLNVKPIPEDNMYNQTAHEVGKRFTQAGDFVMQNPAGQMALFSAPMLAPMFMGGQDDGQEQQQYTPEQIDQIRRQQMRQQYGG